jgi:D-ribulokinase
MTSENPTSGATDSTRHVIGVDVGTGSARAGIFDLAGRMMASAKRDITLHRHRKPGRRDARASRAGAQR